MPFRIGLDGEVDDRRGLGYRLIVDWAFGLVSVIAINGEPVMICLFGLRIWKISIKSLKKEKKKKRTGKKRRSARDMFLWTKGNFQKIAMILKRFVRAVFLKGYIVGWIGLPDPADTAQIGLLCRLLRVSKDRFRLSVNCVYDREIFNLNARVQATLIIGYLGLIALGLFLEKETRVMIRGLARA